MDGYDKPLVLNAALTISDDGIHVDFDGTSPASSHGINVVYNYCLAYTAFGVKCLVAPDVPNNAGSLAPITVSAPEGCVLNVKRPWPVAARHTVGHMLPDVVFGCLHQAIAGGVPAEGASSLWNPQIFGGGSLVDEIGTDIDANALPAFSTVIFHCGGAGRAAGQRRAERDGISFRRAHDTGRSDRKRCACRVLSPRVPRELRRRRQIPRRAWPGHRAWAAPAQHSDRIAVQFRARAQSRARPRARCAGRKRRGVSCVRASPSGPRGARPCRRATRSALRLPGGGGFGDPREPAIRSRSSMTCSMG